MILDMIGDRLKKLRTDAKLSQPEFAALAGTSKQHVHRIEKGLIRDPSPVWIEKWARHFRVRMEWVTTGKLPVGLTDNPPPAEPTSQLERLDAEIIRSAIRLARLSFKLATDDDVLEIERDPELFAAALRTAMAQRQRQGEGSLDAGSGQGDGQAGPVGSAEGSAEDGAQTEPASGRRKKREAR